MREKRIKELRKELNFLIESEVNKEIEENISKLEDSSIDIKKIANEIYLKRGIDVSKLKNTVSGNLIDGINNMLELFKHKESSIKKKMIVDIIYIIILVILIKIPFNLVRDIGYEYIEILSTKTLYNNLWNLAFLLIYTVTVICTFIVFLRNFNNKYKDTKEI